MSAVALKAAAATCNDTLIQRVVAADHQENERDHCALKQHRVGPPHNEIQNKQAHPQYPRYTKTGRSCGADASTVSGASTDLLHRENRDWQNPL
jgi:hypothetical protein